MLEVLANAVRQWKNSKGMQIEKEEILFTDDIKVYVEYLKELTKKLEVINDYSKVVVYKVNIPKSCFFICQQLRSGIWNKYIISFTLVVREWNI